MDERVWKGSGKGLEFFWEDALGTLSYTDKQRYRACKCCAGISCCSSSGHKLVSSVEELVEVIATVVIIEVAEAAFVVVVRMVAFKVW